MTAPKRQIVGSKPRRTSVAKRECEQCELKRPVTSYTSDRANVCNVCKAKTRRKTDRAKHLRTTYDITPHEYDLMLTAQNGKCAGCKTPRRYNLHVDHDHKHLGPVRDQIRGLLCARCNKVLRDVRDDADILLFLCGYLRNPPARKVLPKGDPR